MHEEEIKEIRHLAERMSIRAVAKKTGRNVKTIRAALGRPPPKVEPKKLDPFKPLVADLARQGLRGPRILREIRARGYRGGRTMLSEYLSSIRPPRPSAVPVRRFETPRGREAQVDWSPYRLLIGGVLRLAHAFSMVLCFSRRTFLRFYRDERLPTLLHAHAEAFAYHQGIAQEMLYDNMTQVTLGRARGGVIWHEHFLAFAHHYGFTPKVHRPGHKERSGKVERTFWYIENDFLKARTFASWDDLNAQALVWLETVANVRVHATTKRRVDEAFTEERPLLIALPSVAFGTDRLEVRKVAVDGTVCLDGSFYPVPARLVGQHVRARVYPTRVEILDAAGRVVANHPVPDQPARLPTPGETPFLSPSRSLPRMEAAFLARFPAAGEFLEGLKRKMNALTPVHLRRLEALVALYGEANVREAIDRAMRYRNHSALAVARILEKAHPEVVPDVEAEPLTGDPAALGALDDVEEGSPKDYDFDSREADDGQAT